MKLVPIETQKIPNVIPQRKGSNYNILVEFQESGLDCVELREYPHKNASSAAVCLSLSIKRFRFNIKVIKRGRACVPDQEQMNTKKEILKRKFLSLFYFLKKGE